MSSSDIVTKIGRADGNGSGISRRNFLKIVGTASAVGVAGCADPNKQKIFSNVKGVEDEIPGVAVWYRSTCKECTAGCGIEVRTREGRAVKVEGNSKNPINRGGLCALGQSSLQNLYDPDRVREPMIKSTDANGNKTLKPISWDEAYTKIADAMKKPGPKLFFTGERSGALEELLNSFCTSVGAKRAIFDPMQATAVAKASELTFGVYGVPTYSLNKAEVILNFGTDFLETWVSPVEFARDWSIARKSDRPVRVIHVEPRLSLTGANADLWLSANPGTEVLVALGVLKVLAEKGKGQNLADEVNSGIQRIVSKVSLSSIASKSGVSAEKILLVAEYLSGAESSLVLAGGAAGQSTQALALSVVANLINLALGNVGKTISIARIREPKSSFSSVEKAVADLKKEEAAVVFVDGSNPIYTVPSSLGLDYAIRRAQLVVSFASHVDETTELADLILPSHTPLESWGDSMPYQGAYALGQPTMTPVFNTRELGDMLIGIAGAAGKGDIASGQKNFKDYLQASWKKIHGTLGGKVPADFNRFWLESLESGGYFEPAHSGEGTKVKVSPDAFSLSFTEASFEAAGEGASSLVLYPFYSVKSFDGRAANRPWMQEIPDPISNVVWDAWGELHPETAQKLGLAEGDFVTIRNDLGELNVPVYLTEYVHKGVVAVPIGQGHSSYGRYARQVNTGNVYSLVPAKKVDGDCVALLSTRVSVMRGRGAAELVHVDGSRSQMGRGIARTSVMSSVAGAAAFIKGEELPEGEVLEEGGEGGEEENHQLKQMYKQREHPLYRWGMAVDLAACTGCAACVVACYAENNIPVVGKKIQGQGREMSWIRIERYYDGSAEELQVHFLPMMCQHCGNAPCEPVCPVYATYHNEDGLNQMVYNRCVGTRYCSNNCSYKVRRFNWFEYETPEPLTWQFNPDVTVRTAGVMEKCTFCVQRIAETKGRAKDLGRPVLDGEVRPACVQSCPTQALTFGNLNDPKSEVSRLSRNKRGYKVLDHHINTQPAITYLEDIKYKI